MEVQNGCRQRWKMLPIVDTFLAGQNLAGLQNELPCHQTMLVQNVRGPVERAFRKRMSFSS